MIVSSKITSKYQTTVPKAVRERLGLSHGDELKRAFEDGFVRVYLASTELSSLMGSIQVADDAPDPVEAVRLARELRGREGA